MHNQAENSKSITVEIAVERPIAQVWECWTSPEHIVQWAFASDDWEAPAAQNDVRVGGRFVTTMAAKDGSTKFDFSGEYTEVTPHELIAYRMDDGRMARIEFIAEENGAVKIVETFDMEHENSEELQRAGWQAILENFKKHTESH